MRFIETCTNSTEHKSQIEGNSTITAELYKGLPSGNLQQAS
jgi:hypothetical protein